MMCWKYLIGLVFLIFQVYAAAQVSYSPSIEKKPFNSLTRDSSIVTTWNHYDRFKVYLGFGFPFYDTTFKSCWLEASGRVVFDSSHFYFADPITYGFLCGIGHGSSISLERSGMKGARTLTIQIRDARLVQDSTSKVSFQLTLSESDGRIEAHMGELCFADVGRKKVLGPYSGVYQLKSIEPMAFKQGHSLLSVHGQDSSYAGRVPEFMAFKTAGLVGGEYIKWQRK